MVDVLTDWLRAIGVSSAILCRTHASPPWGMQIEAREEVMFHVMLEGDCWLRREGHPPLQLRQGDLVLVPRGLDHDLVDSPDGEVIPLEEFLERPTFDVDEGHATTLLCGVYSADAELAHPMLRALPPIVRFEATRVAEIPSLSATLALLTAEVEQTSPGGEALIPRLFDALFVYVIRAWADEADAQDSGWLTALKDPFLSKALGSIHAEPEKPWTVESLAREAGLSRAAFARRFSERVGEPPLSYLTRWRMGVAARLLSQSDASVAEIADRIGYESEFAFSRAFKRDRGLAPTTYRQARPERPGSPAL